MGHEVEGLYRVRLERLIFDPDFSVYALFRWLRIEELSAVRNGVKRGSESAARDHWFVAAVIPACGVYCFSIPLILPAGLCPLHPGMTPSPAVLMRWVHSLRQNPFLGVSRQNIHHRGTRHTFRIVDQFSRPCQSRV